MTEPPKPKTFTEAANDFHDAVEALKAEIKKAFLRDLAWLRQKLRL